MNLFQKKLILTSILIASIALVFWTGSRYPQLDAKAMMGVDSPTMGISFDVVKQVESDQPVLLKITYNTLNWMDTNKKGMTFGFLFGSAFILLFSLIKDFTLKNRFLNTAIGAIVGAPLGVCVNCAAPIAKGMKDAGAKTETALATMITSPTMNVIVLSMMFAFLPTYMVWLKIGFTLLFIFFVIPLVSNLFREKTGSVKAAKPAKLPTFNLGIDESDKVISSNWMNALVWTGKSYLKSLWFIVKTTLPLMVLAGLLGNILITFLPLEQLVDIVHNLSMIEKLLYMLGIAIFATILPVPIAFDVIIVAILWSTGLHSRFAMVLLFCLGTFSIYSTFIVAKSFSVKLAMLLFFVTVGFGFAAGVSAHYLEREFGRNYRLEHYEQFKASESSPSYLQFNSQEQKAANYAQLKTQIKPLGEGATVYSENSLEITQHPNQPKKDRSHNKFVKKEGSELGVVVPYHFSVFETHDPFANQRSIASGDIHNDGYPDLLIVSAEKAFIYSNMGGKKFSLQALPKMPSAINNAALVDFDNDGWKDIFLATYRNGNYILRNDSGRFTGSKLIKLPQLENMILTIAPAFADLDKDGLIDIVLGNWSIGVLGAADYTMDAAKNVWLKNEGDFHFRLENFEGIDGETLSLLVSDFSDDGKSDMIVCNDHNVPDLYYLHSADNNSFNWIKDANQLVERSTLTTMSAITADVNNDLVSEIFQVQIDRAFSGERTTNIKKICSEIQNNQERQNCEQLLELQQIFIQSVATRNFENCPEEFVNDCIASELIRAKAKYLEDANYCEYFPSGWNRYQFVCDYLDKEHLLYPRVKDGSYEHKIQGGLLLMKDSNGYFKDQTKQFRLKNTGWAWNSKFCDVDNDGWQDLLVANGFLLKPSQESNIFYKNMEGKYFEEKSKEYGLNSFLPTSSYTYVDYDRDGDVDIVVTPSIGPIYFYENNFHKNNTISFSIEDYVGNRNGVGVIITVYYGESLHQKREILLSGGFKSFDNPMAHFGLGEIDEITRLKINWSTGEETVVRKVFKAGNTYKIRRTGNQDNFDIN